MKGVLNIQFAAKFYNKIESPNQFYLSNLQYNNHCKYSDHVIALKKNKVFLIGNKNSTY